MLETLPKVQRTRGLRNFSSAYQSDFFRSYHKFLRKSSKISSSESRPSSNSKISTKPSLDQVAKNLVTWMCVQWSVLKCKKELDLRKSWEHISRSLQGAYRRPGRSINTLCAMMACIDDDGDDALVMVVTIIEDEYSNIDLANWWLVIIIIKRDAYCWILRLDIQLIHTEMKLFIFRIPLSVCLSVRKMCRIFDTSMNTEACQTKNMVLEGHKISSYIILPY